MTLVRPNFFFMRPGGARAPSPALATPM